MKPELSDNLIEDISQYLLLLPPSRLSNTKAKALSTLLSRSRLRDLGGFDMSIITDDIIVSKKFSHIREAATVEDVTLIMGGPKIYSDGNRIVPSHPWVLPEEELIMWSRASFDAPLSGEGFDRFMKVFQEIYPDKYKLINAREA